MVKNDNTGQGDDDETIHVSFQHAVKWDKKKEKKSQFIFTYFVIKNIESKFIESIYTLIAEYKYFRRRKTVTLRILASYWIKKKSNIRK